MAMTEQNTFKRFDSPEQYAEAFQQMIDARERWREQVHDMILAYYQDFLKHVPQLYAPRDK